MSIEIKLIPIRYEDKTVNESKQFALVTKAEGEFALVPLKDSLSKNNTAPRRATTP